MLIKPNCHKQKNTHQVLGQAKPKQNKKMKRGKQQTGRQVRYIVGSI